MMDDENDKGRPPNSYGVNYHKMPVENASYPPPVGKSYNEDAYNDDDDDEGTDSDEHIEIAADDDDDDDDDDGGNGVQRIGNDDYEHDDEDQVQTSHFGDSQRHPKKRKLLKTLLPNYEFAPRLPPPPASASALAPYKPSFGGRNPLTDWTEHETVVLLNSWGDRFLKRGRKSLRSDEWQEVAEEVSKESRIERTDTQCRNRLDTLKKKYKKEKMKMGGDHGHSKWAYFKKMDELLSSSSGSQQSGLLSCGLDSGEYVFMNPSVYLDRSNGLDEMRDSPENSEDESKGLVPARRMAVKGGADCYKLIAGSIRRFSEVYRKIESNKRQQMVELEKMRMDFHRDLEFQKREILERAQAEIEKIRKGGNANDDDDVSAENISG